MIALAVATLLATAFASPAELNRRSFIEGGVSVSGNVSLSNENQFVFRYTHVYDSQNFLSYLSAEVEGEDDNQGSGSLSGTLIAGGFMTFPLLPPTTYALYVKAETNYERSTDSSGLFDFQASASAVVNIYGSVQEVRPDGTVAKDQAIAGLYTKSTKECVDVNGITDGICYVTYDKSGLFASVDISITFITASTTALLDIGPSGTAITPDQNELIIDVSGWNLEDEANHLRLVSYAATANGEIAGEGTVEVEILNQDNIRLGDPSDPSTPFLHYSRHAIVGETEMTLEYGSIQIEGVAQADFESKSGIIGTVLVNGFASGNAAKSFQKITVDFPAGATSFSLDPSVGFNEYDSASALGAPLAMIAALLAALLALY